MKSFKRTQKLFFFQAFFSHPNVNDVKLPVEKLKRFFSLHVKSHSILEIFHMNKKKKFFSIKAQTSRDAFKIKRILLAY
jgi:hypothetical protein